MNHRFTAKFRASPFVLSGLVLLGMVPLTGRSNPVLPGADPHAVVAGDTIWIYPTWSDDRRGQRFFAFSSTNRTAWQRHGPILDLADVDWIKEDGAERHFAWAPGVLEKDGKWFFYYSVGPQNPTPSRIGVAVGDSPAGPFRDSGRPLLTGGDGFEAIDPMAFTDPESGKTLLYVGGSAGAKLRVFEMNPDLVSFAREVPADTPPQFTEGAFMHHSNGRYYLSYSHGGWRDASYSVHYATSDSPTGPWKYHGAILTSDAARKGPGHHSFITDPHTDDFLIVYHRWDNQTGDGPYSGSRQTCIDRVEYDEAGLIRPVRMTGGQRTEATFRAYFIGNSVTDTVRYGPFAELAKSRGIELRWGRQMIPGAPLEWIYDHPNDGFNEAPYGTYPKALKEFSWDAVSLQPFDRHLVGKNEKGEARGDVALITEFARMAAGQNPDVQIYLYERWPRMSWRGKGLSFDKNDYDPTKPGSGVDLTKVDDFLERWNAPYTGGWDLTNEGRDYFAKLLAAVHDETPFLKRPAQLVPVGQVMAALHRKLVNGAVPGYTSVYQLYKDGIHLNEAGSYLVACTFFATFFDESPVGLATGPYGKIDPVLAKVIQEAIQETTTAQR